MNTPTPLTDAARRGLAAIRENLLPAFVLQCLLGLLVAGYYFWPPSAIALYQLSDWKERGGILFSMAATGFAGAILSELSKVYFAQRGRWTRTNLEDAVFNFLLFSFGGAVVHLFYQQQAAWFGDSSAWSVILRKTTVDMLLFTPFWATPYQTLFSLWKNLRYDWKAVSRELRTTYLTRHYLPLLLMEWAFWIPIVMMTYSLPLILQFPFFLIAMATWGLLMGALTKSGVKKETCSQPTTAAA